MTKVVVKGHAGHGKLDVSAAEKEPEAQFHQLRNFELKKVSRGTQSVMASISFLPPIVYDRAHDFTLNDRSHFI